MLLLHHVASYKNEEEVGAVLREEVSLRGRKAVPRHHIFITSKLRPQDQGYAKALRAFQVGCFVALFAGLPS